MAAGQTGAIGRDNLPHHLRTVENLPSTRTNEQQVELIQQESPLRNGAPLAESTVPPPPLRRTTFNLKKAVGTTKDTKDTQGEGLVRLGVIISRGR